jgi:hypothetical protein
MRASPAPPRNGVGFNAEIRQLGYGQQGKVMRVFNGAHDIHLRRERGASDAT